MLGLGASGPALAIGLAFAALGFSDSVLLARGATVSAKPAADPCAKIAGQTFVLPADAFACQKSFPFNQTLRSNVLEVVSRVFDFYTFEEYYLRSPPPFQESTSNIRGELDRISKAHYATDYDFNRDLYDFAHQLNDGHTAWFPACYNSFQNLLPAPIVSLEVNGTQNVFIIPDLVEFISLVGTNYTSFFDKIGFDWKRLAGAKVLSIAGRNAYDYVDHIATTASGNYLDHGVRVNSVFSSYRIVNTDFSQRFGDLAGPVFVDQNSLTFTLIPVGSTREETVEIPFFATFVGMPFTDKASFWANNCAANSATNGVDLKTQQGQQRQTPHIQTGPTSRPPAKGVIMDLSAIKAVALPPTFQPTLPQVNASAGVIKSYILPDKKTGVMFVGSFEGDFVQFQTDTVSAVDAFQKAGVSRVLIDLTDNGGGFVCLGEFLHQYLAGSNFGYAGFQSTARGNPLAVKLVANNIALNLTNTNYSPANWQFLNGTAFDETHNYMDPTEPLVVNGVSNPTSQRFGDICTPFNVPVPATPPFDLSQVAIVSNGDCASTCAMFSTVMNERHGTKFAVFGGKPGENVEFKGMAGNQVLEWADIDTEIKTANLKNDPLAPPDLLVNANFRHNWRTAWSYFDETRPIAYVSELPKLRFAYTPETYNNPQNLWTFAATQLFK
ncbi:hypothetical protein BD410DRAFT_844665 [Rickenella mellea]|uniref:Tail specific protease domain-containing protein n=1 Tax=Rickenella mellea TaxID=50990 RepID=A0A4Y7PNR0_9AGAM|nr:hypothetical protein BD410DRAFT_844665 [Rickenella mellea]